MAHSPSAVSGTLARALFPAAVAVFVVLPGCGPSTDEVWPAQGGPRVVVSFAPYYCFAASVAGSDATVKPLMTTSGPHHFQPTDRDARLLTKADLFFINGLGLEGDRPEDLKRGSNNKTLKIINLGARIPAGKLLEGSAHHVHGEAHQDGHEKEGPDDHPKDPHVWLSPEYAVYLVEGIRDELKAADPAHAEGYDRRAKEYIARLEKLKADGIEMLKDKKDRRLVTFHESLAYFAKTYDLNIVGVVEKTPGSEPNPMQMKELVAYCADEKRPVRLVTVEPQYSTSNAGSEVIKTLAYHKVPDPQLVEFDTLETVVPDQLRPEWYEEKMRANLNALAEKMK